MGRIFLYKRLRFLTGIACVVLMLSSISYLPMSVYAEGDTAEQNVEISEEIPEDAATAEEPAPADDAVPEEGADPAAAPPAPVRDPITNHLTNWPQMSEINEDSAVLMDADTGAILYSLDRDVQRIPASITKIMTCLLVLENAQMDEVVTMTEAGMAEAYGGSSNISPVLGEQFTVEQCLYMLMLKSANDIAAQLAEHVGGSVEAFVQMMNDRCAAIGTTGTHFNNPNGLPGDNHYTTAMDMALIMQECLKNPTFRQIISTTNYTVPPTNLTPTERTYENHCKLIIPSDTEHYYPDCIGGKTGYTDLAWRTLVSAAERNGRTLICVTLHGSDKRDFTDHRNLFEYGFNSFGPIQSDDVSDDEWDVSGGITVPVGFDISSLSREETALGDGSIRISYKYEDNPVGTVMKTKKSADSLSNEPAGDRTEETGQSSGYASDTSVSGLSAANGGKTSISESEQTKTEDHPHSALIAVLMVLIFILAVAACALYLRRKRERELAEIRRKKRAAKRRRMQKRDGMKAAEAGRTSGERKRSQPAAGTPGRRKSAGRRNSDLPAGKSKSAERGASGTKRRSPNHRG